MLPVTTETPIYPTITFPVSSDTLEPATTETQTYEVPTSSKTMEPVSQTTSKYPISSSTNTEAPVTRPTTITYPASKPTYTSTYTFTSVYTYSGVVTTETKTGTTTWCPGEYPTSGNKPGLSTYPTQRDPSSTPTYTSTYIQSTTYTITSCHPTVTKCALGQLTSEIYTVTTTWCPGVEEPTQVVEVYPALSTEDPVKHYTDGPYLSPVVNYNLLPHTTSTYTQKTTYTVTSCHPTVTKCYIGSIITDTHTLTSTYPAEDASATSIYFTQPVLSDASPTTTDLITLGSLPTAHGAASQDQGRGTFAFSASTFKISTHSGVAESSAAASGPAEENPQGGDQQSPTVTSKADPIEGIQTDAALGLQPTYATAGSSRIHATCILVCLIPFLGNILG
ncbi:hypothetical protein JX265_009294 [Neoarthrinium moseri]|uniref:Uncharacterized protein n=1 Tax=Neoarthrinium moseri TaxID=1658444 RepID=A0A9P9WFV3_9PEZI|nr:hypothetical protein JX265_009294 [Neoarthrinium moseri]